MRLNPRIIGPVTAVESAVNRYPIQRRIHRKRLCERPSGSTSIYPFGLGLRPLHPTLHCRAGGRLGAARRIVSARWGDKDPEVLVNHAGIVGRFARGIAIGFGVGIAAVLSACARCASLGITRALSSDARGAAFATRAGGSAGTRRAVSASVAAANCELSPSPHPTTTIDARASTSRFMSAIGGGRCGCERLGGQRRRFSIPCSHSCSQLPAERAVVRIVACAL